MIHRLIVTHKWAPWSFQAVQLHSYSKAAIGICSTETACLVSQVINTSTFSPFSSLLSWIHACWIPAGALALHHVLTPVTASCDDAGEPDEESTSNEHTAKFTIFSDKARRAAAEERYEEAEKWWEMARREVVMGFGEHDGHMAVIQNGLADVLRRQGGARFAQAEALYMESLRTAQSAYGKADVRYAQALQNLGQYCADAGRHREGLRQLQQALAVKEGIFGKLHIECARVKAIIADVHNAAGHHGKAVTAYHQALDVLRALGQDEGSVAAGIQRRLVAALLARGSVAGALAVVTAMLPYARNVHITEHSTAMHCLETVVEALAARGDTSPAVPAAEALLQVRRDALPEGHANTALAQLVLAKVLLMSRDGSHHRRGLAAAMECTDGLRRAAKALHRHAHQATHPQRSFFGAGTKDAAHPAFARLRANASAVEYGRAVGLCLAPAALATASEGELDRVCQHVGTALKLLLEPMAVNEGEVEEAGVHVPQRVVAKAERMRRETAVAVLQAVIDHPSIARVLHLEKGALVEELKKCRQDA